MATINKTGGKQPIRFPFVRPDPPPAPYTIGNCRLWWEARDASDTGDPNYFMTGTQTDQAGVADMGFNPNSWQRLNPPNPEWGDLSGSSTNRCSRVADASMRTAARSGDFSMVWFARRFSLAGLQQFLPTSLGVYFVATSGDIRMLRLYDGLNTELYTVSGLGADTSQFNVFGVTVDYNLGGVTRMYGYLNGVEVGFDEGPLRPVNFTAEQTLELVGTFLTGTAATGDYRGGGHWVGLLSESQHAAIAEYCLFNNLA